MMLPITAISAVSALGVGRAAHLEALVQRRSGLRANDFDVAAGGWIGRVAAADRHRLPPHLARYDCRNNRLADLALGADGFAEAALQARARWGAARIGVVVGTSTSGVLSGEIAYREGLPDGLPESFDFEATQDLGSLAAFVGAALGLRGPAYVVSVACASSARCFAEAAGLIEAGVCDAVVVGGADSLCRMTLHGFAALELIAPGPTRPGAAERDGISIGEAAGFALLEREAPAAALGVHLLGWGSSSDAHHMSQPHPEGAGAVAAMRGALNRAGLAPEAIDWVNLHGTGTRANDATEDRALHAVFGTVAASSTKGWTGHTLGACGVLEAAIAAECLRVGLVPGALGVERSDPAFAAGVTVENADRPIRRVLSNAFGFGGVNCSLILGRDKARHASTQPAHGALEADIAGYAVWAPGLDDATGSRAVLAGTEPFVPNDATLPPPGLLPPNERRRAGAVVRLALTVAERAVAASGIAPDRLRAVFASANGDGPVVGSILDALTAAPDGAQRIVSPTQFHNSVHNAAVGYWSIATGSRLPATCLGAHDATWAAGLLAAMVELRDGDPVLLCAYDHPMPARYAAKRPIDGPFGVALVLIPAGTRPRALARLRASHAAEPVAEPGGALADQGLRALTLGNPAARSLPLLSLLASGRDGRCDAAWGEGRVDIELRAAP